MFDDFLRPTDSDLVEFLALRAAVEKSERVQIPHPYLINKKDAFIYWLNIYKQDRPIFFTAGLLGLMFIPIFWVVKLIFSLLIA